MAPRTVLRMSTSTDWLQLIDMASPQLIQTASAADAMGLGCNLKYIPHSCRHSAIYVHAVACYSMLQTCLPAGWGLARGCAYSKHYTSTHLVGQVSKSMCNAKSALGKGLHLKDAHGAIPDHTFAALQLCLKGL